MWWLLFIVQMADSPNAEALPPMEFKTYGTCREALARAKERFAAWGYCAPMVEGDTT